MRGRQDPQATMLALVDLETRVPAGRRFRTLEALADEAPAWLSPKSDPSKRGWAATRSRLSGC